MPADEKLQPAPGFMLHRVRKLLHSQHVLSSGNLQRAKGKPLVKIPTRGLDMVLELENEAARDALVDRLSPLVQQVLLGAEYTQWGVLTLLLELRKIGCSGMPRASLLSISCRISNI